MLIDIYKQQECILKNYSLFLFLIDVFIDNNKNKRKKSQFVARYAKLNTF